MITTIQTMTTGAPLVADPLVVEAIAGIYRIETHGATVGYVQLTGERFVSLMGPVYNTSVEIAQTLTLDAAVRRLLAA
ncbi:MAG TPA: hypothetical protein VGM70_04600 [Pseudolysinimonas sp.]|jgi:hypothetical protein